MRSHFPCVANGIAYPIPSTKATLSNSVYVLIITCNLFFGEYVIVISSLKPDYFYIKIRTNLHIGIYLLFACEESLCV